MNYLHLLAMYNTQPSCIAMCAPIIKRRILMNANTLPKICESIHSGKSNSKVNFTNNDSLGSRSLQYDIF